MPTSAALRPGEHLSQLEPLISHRQRSRNGQMRALETRSRCVFRAGERQTFPWERVPTHGRCAGHTARSVRSLGLLRYVSWSGGPLAACGRRFGRSTVVDEVGADVAGGQFELAGFDDRELLAYETFGSGCHNGRAIVMRSLSTQIKLIAHQLI